MLLLIASHLIAQLHIGVRLYVIIAPGNTFKRQIGRTGGEEASVAPGMEAGVAQAR